MSNDEPTSTGDSESNDGYYVPATFQFSKEPGRIERILVGLFDEEGELEARTVSDDSEPEFFVPAMFQFSTDPGRIERFLQSMFEGADDPERRPIPEEFQDAFYLPGANPDEFGRSRGGDSTPPKPASEVSTEDSSPDE